MDGVNGTDVVQPPLVGLLVLGGQRQFGHIETFGFLPRQQFFALDAREKLPAIVGIPIMTFGSHDGINLVSPNKFIRQHGVFIIFRIVSHVVCDVHKSIFEQTKPC